MGRTNFETAFASNKTRPGFFDRSVFLQSDMQTPTSISAFQASHMSEPGIYANTVWHMDTKNYPTKSQT